MICLKNKDLIHALIHKSYELEKRLEKLEKRIEKLEQSKSEVF